MSDKTKNKPKQKTSSIGDADYSATLETAIKMIKHQEYLLKRSDEMVTGAIKRYKVLITCANELETENARLKNELKLYERKKSLGFWSKFNQ